MTISANDMSTSRQYPLAAMQRFSLAQLESGVALDIIKVPFNTIVVNGILVIETAFDSGTSDLVTIGDDGGGGTADPDRYLTSTSIAAAGATVLTATGFKFTASGNITLTWTGAGDAATEGAGYLLLEYINEGRHSFEQVPSY